MKIIVIVLLSLLLDGCSTNIKLPNKPNEILQSDESVASFSDYELKEIDRLILEGKYFDSLLTSPDNLSYTLNDKYLSVVINEETKIDIKVFLSGIVDYDYAFEPIEFSYVVNGEEKHARLSTSIKLERRGHVLFSELVQGDGKSQFVYFNPEYETEIVNSGKPEIENELNNKLLEIYKKQWSEVMIQNFCLQVFGEKFHQIFLGPSYYVFEPIEQISFDSTVKLDWLFNPDGTKPLIHPKNFVYHRLTLPKKDIENWDTNKLYNTLSLLFYIPQSFDSDTTLPKDDLVQAILSVNSDYRCLSSYCIPTSSDIDMRYINKYNYHTNSLLTETYLNYIANNIFSINQIFSIDETKSLTNGIIQDYEEKYYFGNTNPTNFNSYELIINAYEDNADTITIDLSLYELSSYKYCYSCTGNITSYLIKTKDGTTIELDEKYKLETIPSYIKEHSELFENWTIQLQKNDDPNYYKIIYATKN